MIRNFALTFAAVTLRVQLGACAAAGLTFESFYPLLAWTSWLPNLIAAEWIARRRRIPDRIRPETDLHRHGPRPCIVFVFLGH